MVTSASSAPWTQQSYYEPLIHALTQMETNPVRVEVVPTVDHWESAFVATHLPLARGWERQLDIADNSIFYTPGALNPVSYRSWLWQNGVSFVALPDAPLDYAATAEGALLRSGEVSDLSEVWADQHWTVWRVDASPGLVSGPGALTELEPDHLMVDAFEAGTITVRVRYTPFWSVTAGQACVSANPAPPASGGGTGSKAASSVTAPPAPIGWTRIVALLPRRHRAVGERSAPPSPLHCP